jgi:hypothetical protein
MYIVKSGSRYLKRPFRLRLSVYFGKVELAFHIRVM